MKDLNNNKSNLNQSEIPKGIIKYTCTIINQICQECDRNYLSTAQM